MKKSQKKNYVVVALLVVLLFLAIGYAAFSEVLTVSGTATGTGTWNVHFGDTATLNPASYSENGPQVTDTTITVDDLTLGYPGDGCTLSFTIVNEGTLPAKLTSLEILDSDGETAYSDSEITITAPSIEGETLAAGQSCPVTVSIVWDADSTVQSATADFVIEFTYDQSTTPAEVEATHGTHTAN